MLALTIREKNGEERQLIIDQEDVTIGRAAGSDIVLPRSNISKRHARLVDKHDKVVVVDLRSTNGTYVNGRRITAPELLTYDDKVYIGDFVIRLTRPAEQHASQRLAGPYTAGPPAGGGVEPRGARMPTQAHDVAPAARFTEDDPPPPPMTDAFEAPPMDDPDDDASTRAVDLAMIDEIDARFAAAAPPPPPPRMDAPPPPPEPALEAQKVGRTTVEYGARAPLPKPPMPPPRMEVPPAPPAHDEDLVATRAIPVPKELAPPAPPPVAPKARAAAATTETAQPAPPPEPQAPEVAPPEVGAEEWAEAPAAEDNAWAAWNQAIGLLVSRFEAESPEDREAADAQGLVDELLDTAIANGEISPEIDRAALTEDVLGELVSIGPIGDLESDETVRIVYLNGPRAIFASRQDGAIESTGRVFATSRSYRRALRLLTQGTGIVVADPDSAAPGLQEARLQDGSLLRLIEPGGGGDPVAVWRRARAGVPTLADLETDGVLTGAQRGAIEQAAWRGDSILVCGAPGEVREALGSAIAAAFGTERRVVRVGDGSGLTLPHFNAVTVFPAALIGASEVSALEPELVVFEPLDGRLVADWVEAALVVGCPILALTAEADINRAIRRLALAVDLHSGTQDGLGERLVREAVAFAVSLTRDADGAVRVHRTVPVGEL
jgi:pilus assembly protein CpaF